MQRIPTHPLNVKTKSLLIALVLSFLLSLATPAAAITPHGRLITGTIKKVDTAAREVEMLREDNGTLKTFVWNRYTNFIANAQFADASILKKGARVEVNCHTPFFGKPFVTKVTLLQTNNQNNKTK